MANHQTVLGVRRLPCVQGGVHAWWVASRISHFRASSVLHSSIKGMLSAHPGSVRLAYLTLT